MNIIRYISVELIVLFILVQFQLRSQNNNTVIDQNFKNYQTRIYQADSSMNIAELSKIYHEIEDIWINNSMMYPSLIKNICNTLSSFYFKDGRQYNLMDTCVINILQKSEKVPIDIHLEMLELMFYLEEVKDYIKRSSEDSLNYRKERAQLCFIGWERLTKKIIKNWDENDLPLLNVSPPYSTGLPPGISPDAISDSALRRKYELAIDENTQKTIEYNKQYDLREFKDRFIPEAQNFIIKLYSTSPYNLDELEMYLNNYIEDKDLKKQILDAVKKNIKLNKK